MLIKLSHECLFNNQVVIDANLLFNIDTSHIRSDLELGFLFVG